MPLMANALKTHRKISSEDWYLRFDTIDTLPIRILYIYMYIISLWHWNTHRKRDETSCNCLKFNPCKESCRKSLHFAEIGWSYPIICPECCALHPLPHGSHYVLPYTTIGWDREPGPFKWAKWLAGQPTRIKARRRISIHWLTVNYWTDQSY